MRSNLGAGIKRADLVAVSIFVNPAQFNSPADLAAYPRTLEADLAACAARGVDVAFLPTDAELYPPGHQTWVEVSELAKPLCGATRPGHFRGVATVVAKLLIAAKPHVAVFGAKDFQQLAIVRRMVRDLDLGQDGARLELERLGRTPGLGFGTKSQGAHAATRSCARRSAASKSAEVSQ